MTQTSGGEENLGEGNKVCEQFLAKGKKFGSS